MYAALVVLLLLCIFSCAAASQKDEDAKIRAYMQAKHNELFRGEEFDRMENILTMKHGASPVFSRHTYVSYSHNPTSSPVAGTALLGIYLTEDETKPGWLEALLITTRHVKEFLEQKKWNVSFFVMAITDANTHEGYVARCHYPWIFLNHEGRVKRFVAYYYSCAVLNVISPGNRSLITS